MMYSTRTLNLLIVLAGLLLFVPFLGKVHLFDWDEINFAECAREMLVTGDYSSVKINFEPFWEKPPLFIWMQALSMNVFGVSEFSSRLPNALCGIITLLLVFNIGRKIYDNKFGILWALAFAGSFLPHFYFKSGIIDPWFNLFIFCGIYFFILFTNNDNAPENNRANNKRLILSALFIALGVMTKGPVALLVFLLCFALYLILKRFNGRVISWKQISLYAFTVAFVGGLWFLIEMIRGRTDIIAEFFNYQLRLLRTEDSGHGGPFYFHIIVLLLGCFPASIMALRAFKKDKTDTPYQAHFKTWMIILFFVVLVLFSVVKTKILHYSSLCYFPLTFLSAYCMYKIMNKEISWKKWMGYSIGAIGSLIGIAMLALPLIDKYKEEITASDLIHDDFALANLQADVHWNGYEWLPGALFLTGIITTLVLASRRRFRKAIIVLFLASLITVNMASLLIAPKVEQYSQGAAIEFYQKHIGKGIPVETLGFKSYAHLFYTQKQSVTHAERGHKHFVTKINYSGNETMKSDSTLTEIYRKNGFVFWDNTNGCFLHQ